MRHTLALAAIALALVWAWTLTSALLPDPFSAIVPAVLTGFGVSFAATIGAARHRAEEDARAADYCASLLFNRIQPFDQDADR